MRQAAGRMFYLHALTPLHTGTGQAVGVLDLPIARERATGWPVVPASSLKGVLRDALDDGSNAKWIEAAFGPPTERAADHAGGLRFGDQRILLLPVRSFFGTFAYVTCPLALNRLARDCRAAGVGSPFGNPVPPATDDVAVQTLPNGKLARDRKVYLEDLDLSEQPSPEAAVVAQGLATVLFSDQGERQLFLERFAVVSDLVFDFLSETATEVTARVRLKDDTRTVTTGGLWYEEAVPAEAVFCGPVIVASHEQSAAGEMLKPLDEANGKLIQIGGKASVGRGLCRLVAAQP
jgi:CRISPR-associated protein Cmr4